MHPQVSNTSAAHAPGSHFTGGVGHHEHQPEEVSAGCLLDRTACRHLCCIIHAAMQQWLAGVTSCCWCEACCVQSPPPLSSPPLDLLAQSQCSSLLPPPLPQGIPSLPVEPQARWQGVRVHAREPAPQAGAAGVWPPHSHGAALRASWQGGSTDHSTLCSALQWSHSGGCRPG